MIVKQEEIFLADINGIIDMIKKKLQKVQSRLGLIKFMNKTMIEMMQIKLEGVIYTLENLVSLKKLNDRTYAFVYPSDSTALLALKNLPIKIGGKDYVEFSIIHEGRFIEGLRKITFKSMGIKENDCTISIKELEGEQVRGGNGKN